ncbi:MAG TPA: hypothetical protein VGO07_00870 [Candidatus Saccharimonadales bacterium]|jgi:hypothetical protein|nr:hypothetical protein [Candidatus Saccharimonadales bacterium]
MRSLGYVASALEVAKNHLPRAQVQFVYTIRTGQRVNGILPRDSATPAGQFRDYGRRLIDARYADMADSVTFLTDPAGPPDIDEAAIAEALTHTSPHTQEQLLKSAGRRQGSHLSYVAAHLVMHDTIADLVRPHRNEPAPIEPGCVVSLGAQSERPFYETRMTCRAQGVEIPGLLEATGQLFTRHVLPPYLKCREGEISVTSTAFDASIEQHHPVLSVQRDLVYLQQIMAGEQLCVSQ